MGISGNWEKRRVEQIASLGEIDRRTFVTLGGASAAALIFGAGPFSEIAAAEPKLSDYPFKLGVASGDPTPDGVVLWTRLAPDPLADGGRGGMPSKTVKVNFEVAEDERFSKVVRRGSAYAAPELAHSVHVELGGLAPGREYFYRFKAGAEISPVGRTKTAPAFGSSPDGLNFAFASCQAWPDGYYSPYHRMAEEDLDLVVHLGDYIYEYGIDANGGNRHVPVPDNMRNETTTLSRYRLQYALYKGDPDLQKVHALFPWTVTWDDHEVENDYTGDIPESPPFGQAFLERRAAAYQAYYEHLPLRRSSMPSGPDMPIYRRLTYGDLAEFSVLDTRQYRDDQPCGDGEHPRCPASFDPDQQVTGPAQEKWLLGGLDSSQARWNIIAQQVLMAELDHKLGEGEIYWQDSWDGYPVARNRILSHIADNKPSNPVVITGDWHSTFVSDLKLDFKDPASPTIASEFTCTSISTNGDGIVYGPYYGPMIPENPHIKFFDGDRRGYIRCRVTPDEWQSDLRMVTTVSRPDAPVYTLASFVVEDGVPGPQQVSGAQSQEASTNQAQTIQNHANPRVAADRRMATGD